MVPTEKSQTLQNGKRRVVETKHQLCHVEMKLEDDGRIQQDVFFLIKKPPGLVTLSARRRPRP